MAHTARDQKAIDAAYEKVHQAISNLLLLTYSQEFTDIHVVSMSLYRTRERYAKKDGNNEQK